jgi:KaiC/GvpD/RAD55 family RecA-like ATPase
MLQLKDLEELLADMSRFFSRFSRPNYRIYQLVGQEPLHRLEDFHNKVHSILRELAESVHLEGPRFYMPPSKPKYYFICDKLLTIRNSLPSEPEVAQYVAAIQDDSQQSRERITTEYRKEMHGLKDAAHHFAAEAMEILSSEQACLIKQKAFRALWMKKSKKRRLTMVLRDFCELVRKQLIHHSVSYRESEELAKRLADIINNRKPVTATDNVTEYQLAKILRHVPTEEAALGAAIRMVYPGVLAPPLTDTTVYFDIGQEEELTDVIAGGGFSCVTGPPSSGKTCRVRHIVKKLVQEANTGARAGKDVVWVDFDGVRSDVDGVMRVASQLYFKRCNVWSELEKQYTQLLNSLRQGAIVILDNVYLSTDDFITANESRMNLRELQQSTKNTWKYFIIKLCKLGRELQKTVSFIIVTNMCEPFTAVLPVKKVVTVSSLTRDVGTKMATTLTLNILVSKRLYRYRCRFHLVHAVQLLDHSGLRGSSGCLELPGWRDRVNGQVGHVSQGHA